jgi:molybdopterin-guanine dinucleotide biosynthesis protein B
MSIVPLPAGIVLAGGLGRRMGGGDKPLVAVGGRAMLARAVERLAPQVARLAINANGDPERFRAYGLPVVADTVGGFAGPLAGVLAGMRWAKANAVGSRFLLSAAGDTPFFPRDLAARLLAAGSGDEGTIVVARSSGGAHPVFALWPVRLADDLDAFLTGGERKILAFVDRYRRLDAHFDDVELENGAPLDPFFNVNTPADAARAEEIAAMLGSAGVTVPVFGVTGWKNSGKTTLVTKLVREFVARGFRVSTVKHAHHDFDIDKPATDSFRHREAGASEVLIVSGNRWALMHELRGGAEPPLEAALLRLSPCDLILVEGYKREAHPKIEVRRRSARAQEPLAPGDPSVLAVAADHATDAGALPLFALDDVAAIADFIAARAGLAKPDA